MKSSDLTALKNANDAVINERRWARQVAFEQERMARRLTGRCMGCGKPKAPDGAAFWDRFMGRVCASIDDCSNDDF